MSHKKFLCYLSKFGSDAHLLSAYLLMVEKLSAAVNSCGWLRFPAQFAVMFPQIPIFLVSWFLRRLFNFL